MDAPPIPFLHNYCDRRCGRCPLSHRCEIYRPEPDGPTPWPPTAAAAATGEISTTATVIRSLRHAVRTMRQLAEQCGFQMTEEEFADARREEDARYERAVAAPLVRSAKEYCLTALPILQALRPIGLQRGDDEVLDALETLEAVAPIVATKIYRAVSQRQEEDDDPGDVQSDANGSAKVARLVIADSRRAWQVMMEKGRATADGVPAQLVRRLEELDAGVAAHFPHAMEFMRPGFDTGEDVEAALLAIAGQEEPDA
jgi:hypothetical protein